MDSRLTPPDWAIKTDSDRQAIKEGCYWDQQAADRIILFIETVFRSQFIKGKIKLRPLQVRLLQEIEGWRLPDGRRRWRLVHLHCPKKGFGKTLIAAIYAFYSLFSGIETSPVVYTAAATRDNAAQIYKELVYAIDQAGLKQFTKTRNNVKEIDVPSLNASYKSLAALGDKNHGWNCSTVVIDEAAVVPAALWNVLRYATDARPQNGLVLVISTCGEDQTTWYFKLYEKSKRIISNQEIDITHLGLVFEAEPESDPTQEEQWIRANPYLGSPEFPLDQFRRDFYSAKSLGMMEYYNFLNLKLNMWVKVSDAAYFDVSDWSSHEMDIPEDQLKRCVAMAGGDLSQTTDPSSYAICYDIGDGCYHFAGSKVWINDDGVRLREKTQLKKYEDFKEVEYTKGDMIDYRLIRDHIIDSCKQYQIFCVNFDPTSAYMMANEIEDEGYKTERIPQNWKHFNPALTEFRRLYEEGKITFAKGSDWLRYCFQNVRVELNKYGEVRPHKGRSVDKIDGAIACLLAFLGHLGANKPASNVGYFGE